MTIQRKQSTGMKLKLALAAFILLIVAGARAQLLVSNSFEQDVNTIIPDDNPNGLRAAIQVSGLSGSLADVSVNLFVTNGFNGDYYAYLVDPNGDFAVLLNRAGVTAGNSFGYADSGFDITLSSSATNNIHFYQSTGYTLDNGVLTGTWVPDGRRIDPESTPSLFDTAPTTSGLSSDLGTNPDGTWTLFIGDFSGGYEGTLVNWQINLVTPVPEPSATQLIASGGLLGLMALYHGRRRIR